MATLSRHFRLPALRQRLLDWFYPPRCAACVTRMEAPATADFCPACERELERIEGPRCQTCSEAFTGDISGPFTCPNCNDLDFAFECAITSWHCTGPLREAIHRYKYGRAIQLRQALGHKLYDTLDDPRFPSAESPDPDQTPWLLVPVPLHSRRFRERKFNQSAELARTLSRLSGYPFHDLLQRTRYTTAQAALNRQQRLKNLAGAFTLKPKTTLPPHEGILLIDDVFTTGSTAHECALALQKAGARRIIVLTVARG
jgi:competence protein ComFC